MGKMLHNEARELLVESYEKTHNAEEIAKIFGVNKYTVYHMAERKRKTGSVALRTSQRGRKQLLNEEDKQHYHAAGIELRYLPPYSPDMNPIEMLWSKVKALLRKWKCRTAELLPEAVSCGLLRVSQRDCVGWFKADGCCL